MRVFRRFAELPPSARGASVAIGNFDGLHRGHRAVLAAADSLARERGAPLGVVTFEPHPREVLTPETAPRRLTPFRRKAELLREAGVALLYVLPFEPKLMRLPAETFGREVLAGRLGIVGIAAGADFRFGHKRQGDLAFLAELGRELGFAVVAVPPVEHDGVICSSTAVRQLLEAGDVARADAMLGHAFEVAGIVRPGDARGRELGYPTANVHPIGLRPMLPAKGIYVVRAGVVEKGGTAWHPAVASLGERPTFNGSGLLLEVHLLDGAHALYGLRLRVAFLERLRDELRFPTIPALQAQMAEDCAAARRWHERATIPDMADR